MSSEIDINQAFEKALFLFGAGFSYGTGCLTSRQMYDDLQQMILAPKNTYFDDIEKEAFRFLIANMAYHNTYRTQEIGGDLEFNPNIEELALLIRRIGNREHLVPYSITGNWADKLIQLEARFSSQNQESQQTLFQSLYYKLKNLLKEKWLVVNENNLGYLQPLLKLLQDTATSHYALDIFSLNNDLVLETFFSQHEQIPWRGFVQGEWQGLDREKNEKEFGRINLYKLHGSVDWLKTSDYSVWEESKVKLNSDERFNMDEIKQSSLVDPFVHYPYIVFGQGTKTFSVEPFFSLINHFHIQLKNPEKKYIFVIGYSFFDPYINNLLFDSAKDDKVLIIVNPNLGPKKLFQKFELDGNMVEKPKSDPDRSYRVQYTDECSQSDFIDYFKKIQQNSFYSELPEFNSLDIRGQNIEFIPLPTNKFIDYFFTSQAEKFVQLISQYEHQNKNDLPF